MRLAVAAAVVAAFCPIDPIHAAEVNATSRVTAVTVFPTGAEVVRSARVTLAAGEHTALFTDLPAQAIPGSIRVEGKAAGRLEIGSVDTRRVLVPRSDPAAVQSERRRLEADIETLKDERAAVEADIKSAETQKALIQRLTELPGHPAPAGPQGAPPQPDWNQMFNLIGQRMAEAQKAQLDAQVKQREIDRKIEDLNKRLAALAPLQDERTELKVFLAAGGALEADIAIRYQVSSASWQPYYDARLTTGARNAAPRLTLARRASVQQRTGEDWQEVALALSTTRPGTGTAAPRLNSLTVDFEAEGPPRPVAVAPSVGATRGLRRPDTEAAGEEETAQPKARAEAASERTAIVETAPFQAVFSVPGSLTVLATGEQKRVKLDEAQIDPQLMVRTAPSLQPKAFLYAKLVIPKPTAYLPGQVSLFRDSTFVGSGRLPMLAPGQEHELGFGPDDSVQVRHALLEEKRGESGLITSSKTDQRNFRITVKNLHEQAINVTVMDRIPVSLNQELKVELTGKSVPTRRDVDELRGVFAWDAKLEPDEERQIEFGYRITWPAGKRITYGR